MPTKKPIWTLYSVDPNTGQWCRLYSSHAFVPTDMDQLLAHDPQCAPVMLFAAQLARERGVAIRLNENGITRHRWEPSTEANTDAGE